MLSRSVWQFAKRTVPINCRTPTPESTRLTSREKLEWVAFIAVLTVVPVGFQLWQFEATSATTVNRAVMDELARKGEQAKVSAPNQRRNELTV